MAPPMEPAPTMPTVAISLAGMMAKRISKDFQTWRVRGRCCA